MVILWPDIESGSDLVTSNLDGFSDHLTSIFSISGHLKSKLATSIKKWDIKWDYVRHKNHNTHLQKTPKMAELRLYDPLLHGFIWAKNHPTKNAIEQKYSPRACASSGHAPWRCPTDFPFHGLPPALLTIFYIMNRQQGSRSA